MHSVLGPELRYRIVIVEDEWMIAMDLSELLTEEGHEVCAIAGTEAAAVAAAARYAPDMIIIDGHLGAGSGIAAMQQILAQGPMPHVYMSGDCKGVRALSPRAVVIDKPFSMPSLLAAMAEARRRCGMPSPSCMRA